MMRRIVAANGRGVIVNEQKKKEREIKKKRTKHTHTGNIIHSYKQLGGSLHYLKKSKPVRLPRVSNAQFTDCRWVFSD